LGATGFGAVPNAVAMSASSWPVRTGQGTSRSSSAPFRGNGRERVAATAVDLAGIMPVVRDRSGVRPSIRLPRPAWERPRLGSRSPGWQQERVHRRAGPDERLRGRRDSVRRSGERHAARQASGADSSAPGGWSGRVTTPRFLAASTAAPRSARSPAGRSHGRGGRATRHFASRHEMSLPVSMSQSAVAANTRTARAGRLTGVVDGSRGGSRRPQRNPHPSRAEPDVTMHPSPVTGRPMRAHAPRPGILWPPSCTGARNEEGRDASSGGDVKGS
jgi:hypothetical protein